MWTYVDIYVNMSTKGNLYVDCVCGCVWPECGVCVACGVCVGCVWPVCGVCVTCAVCVGCVQSVACVWCVWLCVGVGQYLWGWCVVIAIAHALCFGLLPHVARKGLHLPAQRVPRCTDNVWYGMCECVHVVVVEWRWRW